ncbi:MAG: hypothetical protein E7033_01070 [Akkermansiaceae bacterium]|nr:hypothetical protein [Akkermansiaceae bacterium]
MVFTRESIKKLALQAITAGLGAAAITTVTLFWVPEPQIVPPEPLHHKLQPELVCLAAATATEPMPDSVASDAPHLRLREYAPGQYELLYWGNPVRPHYTFSITNIWDGSSVLLQDDGTPQQYRDLIVSVPRRADNALPLQPVIKLGKLKGKPGDYYSAKVCVHDAADGKVLCHAVYLICGNSSN